MNFKSLGLGIALTCGTFAFSSTINSSQTQAATVGKAEFGGIFSFENQSQVNPQTETLNFRNPGVVFEANGVFGGATTVNVGTGLGNTNPFSLLLNRDSVINSTSATYTANLGSLSNALLSFNNGVQFYASGIANFVRSTGTNTTAITAFNIPGTFSNGLSGEAVVSMTGQQLPGVSTGSYSWSIVAQEVPEPLTILGSVTALGLGTVLKKKSTKKQSKEKAIV